MTLPYERKETFTVTRDYPWSADTQTLSWVPEQSRVLELGCATGHAGEFLRRTKHCLMFGIERHTEMAQRARMHYEHIWNTDLDEPHTYSVIEGRFDVILCSNVLEHTKDPSEVLVKLRERLNPEGRIIVALPNIAHWSMRLHLLRGAFTYQTYGILDKTHLRFFTYDSAQKLVKDAGFLISRLSIDADAGIPIFQGIIRRIPFIGWKFLWLFYKCFPNLFGYQILIEAKPR